MKAKEIASTNFVASMISFGAAAFSSLGTGISTQSILIAIAFGNMTGVIGIYALILSHHNSRGDSS